MSNLRDLYRVERLPVFQNRMFNTAEEARACSKGDVVLVQDMDTGLIFNNAFDPELMQYDADYQNEQACSGIFKNHLNNVASVIKRHLVGCSLIEVGCGKGHFLEHLQSEGFAITGVDPTYEGDNPKIIKEYFSPKLGLSADGIVLRHVLEHVPNPLEFLSTLREANAGRGKIYIEVPCFDWICERRAWFDIYYEHVNYFRLSDFRRMFGTVFEEGRIFGSQYLYVVADLATLRVPHYEDACSAEFPKDFLYTVKMHANRLKAQSTEHRARCSAIWGGASKGVIFALFMQRASAPINLVIDVNPAKQGKHLGGIGLRVYSPEEAIKILMPGADMFVMNSNYLSEIIEQSGNQFNYVKVDHEIV